MRTFLFAAFAMVLSACSDPSGGGATKTTIPKFLRDFYAFRNAHYEGFNSNIVSPCVRRDDGRYTQTHFSFGLLQYHTYSEELFLDAKCQERFGYLRISLELVDFKKDGPTGNATWVVLSSSSEVANATEAARANRVKWLGYDDWKSYRQLDKVTLASKVTVQYKTQLRDSLTPVATTNPVPRSTAARFLGPNFPEAADLEMYYSRFEIGFTANRMFAWMKGEWRSECDKANKRIMELKCTDGYQGNRFTVIHYKKDDCTGETHRDSFASNFHYGRNPSLFSLQMELKRRDFLLTDPTVWGADEVFFGEKVKNHKVNEWLDVTGVPSTPAKPETALVAGTPIGPFHLEMPWMPEVKTDTPDELVFYMTEIDPAKGIKFKRK